MKWVRAPITFCDRCGRHSEEAVSLHLLSKGTLYLAHKGLKPRADGYGIECPRAEGERLLVADGGGLAMGAGVPIFFHLCLACLERIGIPLRVLTSEEAKELR